VKEGKKQNKQTNTHARTQDSRHRDCRKELQQTKLQNWEWEKNKTRVATKLQKPKANIKSGPRILNVVR
jgi:hypothetical protein